MNLRGHVNLAEKSVMEIVEILEELLTIDSPFKIHQVLKDEKNEEVHIHLEIDKSYRPSKGLTIHQYYDRTWEHINLFQYRCFLHCRLPIYLDKQSGKTQSLEVEFSREHSRFTLLYEQHIMTLMSLYHCYTKVAHQLGLNPQRVESVYHYYTSDAYEAHSIDPCEKVGIDETSTKKGHDYITAFVDLETHRILDLEDGKSSEAITKFFHNHPNPTVVKQISIDMSPAFISGVNQCFPWARITFDKWHVFKLLGKHLDELAKRFKSKAGLVHLIHEHLSQFYQQIDIELAKAQLSFIADFAVHKFGKNSFSKSIHRHFDGIVEYIQSRITNGLLEGINSKIQTIKRVAKGFRYTENFKKMILFVFGIIKPKFKTT